MAVRPLLPPARTTTTLLAIVLLLGGCSGDDGDGAADSSASPDESAQTATESPAEPSPTEVALGRAAPVELSAGRRGGEASVTVTRVRKGAIKDLSDFVLDRRTRRSTPYYADVRVENTSQTDLAGASVPLWGLDSEGTVLPPAQVRGSFDTCDSTAMPKRFGQGKKATTCLLFLVPRGRELDAVQYRPGGPEQGVVSWPVD
jgi:hypothetical protein